MTNNRQIEPRQVREFRLDRNAINPESRTVELAWASEQPYERWFGTEILDCQPKSIRLDRMKTGAALLMDHDTRDQVGVVESVTIGKDKVCRATVRFGRSERASEIFQDVQDGIRTQVSVGYMVHKMVLESEEEGRETYRVTDWEPYEISIVSVAADPTVGVGREIDQQPTTSPVITRSNTMADTTAAPAPAQAAPAVQAPAIHIDEAGIRQAELSRVQSLLKMGEDYGLRHATVSDAINAGTTVDAFKGIALNEVVARSKTNAAFLDMGQADAGSYSIRRAILAQADGTQGGLEREAHLEICKRLGVNARNGRSFFLPQDVRQHSRQMSAEGLARAAGMTGKRDLVVGTSTAGGHFVGTDNLTGSMVDMLRARSVSMGLGVRMLSGLVGNVTIPKQTAAGTIYWVSEGSAITESQQTLGQIAMSPKTMGAYTEYSRLLLNQSSVDIDNFIRMDFAAIAALGIDLAVLQGTGTDGQPAGISVTSGIGSVTGTSLAYAGILEFQTDLAASNALTRECAYVTTPAVAALLMAREKFSNTATALWTGNVLDGDVSGFRATTTTQLTAASMIFGDFGQVILGEWGVEEVEVNPYAAFTAGGVGVRLFKSLDVGIRHAAAFSRATSIT